MWLTVISLAFALLIILGYWKHRQINGWADNIPGYDEHWWEWAVVRAIAASKSSKYYF